MTHQKFKTSNHQQTTDNLSAHFINLQHMKIKISPAKKKLKMMNFSRYWKGNLKINFAVSISDRLTCINFYFTLFFVSKCHSTRNACWIRKEKRIYKITTKWKIFKFYSNSFRVFHKCISYFFFFFFDGQYVDCLWEFRAAG